MDRAAAAAAIAALTAAYTNWVSRLLADTSLSARAELRDYERAYLLKAAGL